MVLGKGFWLVVLCGVWAACLGCETNKSNVLGADFINRDPGKVVQPPAIPLASGQSFEELVFPIILGQREELLVGQMNGFSYRSLLRFQVPLDSLAQVAGKSASDIQVDSVRVLLGVRSRRFAENVNLAIAEPTTPWEEVQSFIDTLTLSEKNIASSPIGGAIATVRGDTSLRVDLPLSAFASARAQNGAAPEVELLLGPTGSGEFLLDLVAREAAAVNTVSRHPRLEIFYRVDTLATKFTARTRADTYWGARVNGGPNPDLLIVHKGTFYGTLLNFNIPTSIPNGATINSARLELDVDLDRSFFSSFPFEIYHVEFANAGQDTVYTRYNTKLDLTTGQTTVVFNQALVQAWVTGAQVNEGMALRPVGAPADMTWVVFRNARLKLIYSLPPEL